MAISLVGLHRIFQSALALFILAKCCDTSGAELNPVKIRIYSSITPGVKSEHAIAFTQPMIDLLSRQVQHPLEIAIEDRKSLMQFGKDINEGRIHIGVVWGLEYGWLQQKYPKLEMMAVTTQAGEVQIPTQILVRNGFQGKTFSDLKGQRLATYERAPMMIRRFRNRSIESSGHKPDNFFKQIRTFPIPQDAIRSLQAGEVEAVEIDGLTWNRFVNTQGRGRNLNLKVFLTSDPMPEAVVIGRSDIVNGVRSELWASIQKRLLAIHNTAEGKQCAEFWGLDSYDDPAKHQLRMLINQRIRDYPFIAEPQRESRH